MRKFGPSRFWDLSVLIVSALSIGCYSYFVSRDRILWSDELFAWSLVTDPSWKHMFRAWNLGADSGGPGFYVLCRLWLQLFGRTEVAFRAFSAAGIFAALCSTWFTLRRYYRPDVAALTLLIVYFGSPMVLWHVVQTRFYGLLLGAAGWALYAMLRSSEESRGGTSRRSTLVLAFCANLLLVSAHAFGLFYSGLLLFAAILGDLLAHRKRPAYYASVIAAWPLLILSRAALHNLAKVGQPWFWTTRPHRADLINAYTATLPLMVHDRYLFPLILSVVGILIWRRQPVLRGLSQRRVALIPAVVLMSAPILLWVLSQFHTSYYVDRYFLPYILGAAILVAELVTALCFEAIGQPRRVSGFLMAGAIGLMVPVVILSVLIPYTQRLVYPPRDYTGALSRLLPRGEPVVIPKTDIFDMMAHYRNTREQPILFPYDLDLALDPRSPKWLVSAEREMDNADLAGYYPGEVVRSADLLKTTPRFLVVTDESMPWLSVRVMDQPGWHVEKIGDYQNGFWSNAVYQVSRVGAGGKRGEPAR